MSMRWNETGVAFSRPVRWLVALLGDAIIPFEYAGLYSGRTTRGSRPQGLPGHLPGAEEYLERMRAYGILADPDERRAAVAAQVAERAAEVGGQVPDDPALLEEVAQPGGRNPLPSWAALRRSTSACPPRSWSP